MINSMKALIVIVAIFCLSSININAQVGVSVSPPRVYYEVNPGQTGENEIIVTNASEKHTLELAITLGDWTYNTSGENLIYPPDSLSNSCAGWVSIMGPSYLSLKPKESRNIKVNITVPQDLNDSIPVHTAMLYVTQMNPIDDVDEKGANIKVSIRSGIKLFHRKLGPRVRKIEISNFLWKKDNNELLLEFKNEGNVWLDGSARPYLFNKSTGNEVSLTDIAFYTMPQDKRVLRIPTLKTLERGDYVATVLLDYGDKNNIEAAELQFTHE